MWFYPVPALLALAGWVFLFATTGGITILYGLGVLALGVVVFLAGVRWMNFGETGARQEPGL
jgi:hypothetical protein